MLRGRRTRGFKPLQDAEQHIRRKEDKDVLTWRFINETKGRGVFAKGQIEKGSFIVEYRGTLTRKNHSNEYIYTFKHQGSYYCIDACIEDGSLGRLVNDDPNPNAKMKKIDVDGVPHLCLFAIMAIKAGEEITYDYGGHNLPWRGHEHEKPVTLVVRAPDPAQIIAACDLPVETLTATVNALEELPSPTDHPEEMSQRMRMRVRMRKLLRLVNHHAAMFLMK
ncbi:N-lysine methyltransferase KMT5A-A-like isoform X4 [Solea solea]|uniref:N-lysine methyltransferase KMT5A-A-like isoform X4 n=1 Tax=Solea solea TaxID=90069 RepID=UPI00272D1381|nr:N-lysine methyltransferase KMT5A-A-like isoform X4 [Solea solea]